MTAYSGGRDRELLLRDDLIAAQIPQGWVIDRNLGWDPDVCDDGHQATAHPEGEDWLVMSASLGRAVGATPAGVAAVLLHYFEIDLPQPPSVPLTDRHELLVAGMAATRIRAVFDPNMRPFWIDPGYILDILALQVTSAHASPPTDEADTRWFVTIHRVGDDSGRQHVDAIWASLSIAGSTALL